MSKPLRDPSLPKPTPPAAGECCESGSCTPCVWDTHYEKLQAWRVKQAAYRKALQESQSEGE